MELNKLENVLIFLGTSLGLAQIETILGIIILVFQIGLIIYKAIVGIIDLVKKEEYDKIDDTIEDVIEDLKDLEKEE